MTLECIGCLPTILYYTMLYYTILCQTFVMSLGYRLQTPSYLQTNVKHENTLKWKLSILWLKFQYKPSRIVKGGDRIHKSSLWGNHTINIVVIITDNTTSKTSKKIVILASGNLELDGRRIRQTKQDKWLPSDIVFLLITSNKIR